MWIDKVAILTLFNKILPTPQMRMLFDSLFKGQMRATFKALSKSIACS